MNDRDNVVCELTDKKPFNGDGYLTGQDFVDIYEKAQNKSFDVTVEAKELYHTINDNARIRQENDELKKVIKSLRNSLDGARSELALEKIHKPIKVSDLKLQKARNAYEPHSH